jgi:hypothetical protein
VIQRKIGGVSDTDITQADLIRNHNSSNNNNNNPQPSSSMLTTNQ